MMMMSHDQTPAVLVLSGGPDAERDVSIASGEQVAAALRDLRKYIVIEQIIQTPTTVEIENMGGDVVFPVLHGTWGEGGELQKRLEAIEIPYIGSDPEASELAMDKLLTKNLLAHDGIATPAAQALDPAHACDIEPPLVLKPINDGSSVDLRICHTAEEVAEGRKFLHPLRRRLLAEEYIAGRELTVGIARGRTLPIIEIIPAGEYYDYEAKYIRDDTQYVINPELPSEIACQCREVSLHAFERLGCRDIARVDFMFNEEGLWFLELNTMPGFTSHSLVPMAAAAADLSMPELCGELVEAALARAASGIRH